MKTTDAQRAVWRNGGIYGKRVCMVLKRREERKKNKIKWIFPKKVVSLQVEI